MSEMVDRSVVGYDHRWKEADDQEVEYENSWSLSF